MTNKAKKLFDFIQSYIQKNGIAPSFDEMKNFMGLKSKSSIFNIWTIFKKINILKEINLNLDQ